MENILYEKFNLKIHILFSTTILYFEFGGCSKNQPESGNQNHSALRPLQTMRNLRIKIQNRNAQNQWCKDV